MIRFISCLKFAEKLEKCLKKCTLTPCDTCKIFRKHIEEIEVERYKIKRANLEKQIARKRYFLEQFPLTQTSLIEFGYLKEDYPTEKAL